MQRSLYVSLFLVANFSPYSTKSFCFNEPLLRKNLSHGFALIGISFFMLYIPSPLNFFYLFDTFL
jgi:hypothetical protein